MSDQILDGKKHKKRESGTRKWTQLDETGYRSCTHAVTGGRVREGKTLPGVIRCGQGFNRRRPQGRRI